MSNQLVLRLDASALNEFMVCPIKYHYRYREHLIKTGARTEPLDKGSVMHALLDAYYAKRCENLVELPIKIASAICEQLLPELKKKYLLPEEAWQLLELRFIQYVVNYSKDVVPLKAQKGKDLLTGTELGFSKVLFQDERYLFIVEGRIDLLCEISGKRAVLDHKTQERKSTLYERRVQARTYAWATGFNYFIYNYIGLTKEVTKDTFRREVSYFSDEDINNWHWRMLQKFFLLEQMLKCNAFELNAEQYRNYSACAGAFDSHPCAYTSICEETDARRAELIKIQDFHTEVWEPWKLANEDLMEVI